MASYASNPSTAAPAADLLTLEERTWLDAHCPALVVGSEANYRPYAYVDQGGRLSGLAGDYLALLEQRLGCTFGVRRYDTFNDVLEAARRREIDIVPFVIAAPERESYLQFTAPVYNIADRILTRTDTEALLTLDDLAGVQVGVIDGYALVAELAATRPEIEVVAIPNELAAVRALSFGGIDALIVDTGVAAYHIQREGIANLRIAGDAGEESPQTFGTRSDWPMLNRIIDKGIASISDAERSAMANRWVNLGGVDPTELERLWTRVAVFVAVVGLAGFAVLMWAHSLRRLVARRTLALEEELAERCRVEAVNERLAVAVEQSAEYVLIIDRAGRVEYANLTFLRASGRTDVIGQAFEALGLRSDRETLREAVHSLVDGDVWRGRVSLAGADPEGMLVAMTISPIHGGGASNDGYVATGRDVRHEEQLEARLRHGEKLSALGTLAGGIAHDFNNLLVPILGYVDLLRDQSPPESAPYLDAVANSGERARQLVQRILTFSRQHEGVQEPLDLRAEVEDSVGFLHSLLPATLEIRADLADCGTVIGDRTQIQQILLNLGTNASDAMETTGGTLDITLRPFDARCAEPISGFPDLTPGRYALLTVRDSGVGMDDDVRQRIFDPYFTNKPQGKGTGLGLATVHGIVSAHGGAIYVDSAPGSGATFHILFPVAEQSIPVEGPRKRILDVPAGHGERVLVVDDDALVRDVVGTMLRSLGYSVTVKSDPVDAVGVVRDSPQAFDAVLTDLTMPGSTGVQLAERLHDVRSDLPVIVMSGNTTSIENGSVLSIEKPLRPRELALCLHNVLA